MLQQNKNSVFSLSFTFLMNIIIIIIVIDCIIWLHIQQLIVYMIMNKHLCDNYLINNAHYLDYSSLMNSCNKRLSKAPDVLSVRISQRSELCIYLYCTIALFVGSKHRLEHQCVFGYIHIYVYINLCTFTSCC